MTPVHDAAANGPPVRLVLASSSRYRRELLERLGVPFAVESPEVDETAKVDESPRDLVLRLSVAKARAVAPRWGNSLIVGSDQAATFGGRILGKPATSEVAVRQLLEFAGGTVDFLTGVAVLNTALDRVVTAIDTTSARFRRATEAEIRRYVDHDRPLDCAGGIRFEGLGPLLLDAVETTDPSAAIGLPLIRLGEILRAEGFNPLAGRSA